MPLAVGLDFGTTNSAIAVVTSDATVHLATFQENGQATTTFRSILYFFHPQDDDAGGRRVVAGPEAIQSYLSAEPRGRFMQAMKFTASSVLGSIVTSAPNPAASPSAFPSGPSRGPGTRNRLRLYRNPS